MGHVLRYMDWWVHYWQSLASKRQLLDATVQEGIMAYAAKRAHVMQTMADRFVQEWLPLLKGYSITPSWPEHYISSDTCMSD